jgi:hypothetical protein
MHTVDLLEQALDLIRRSGYVVRPEWLGGDGGGPCELKGKKLFFLDLGLGPLDQLDEVLDALRREPAARGLTMPNELRDMLQLRKIA